MYVVIFSEFSVTRLFIQYIKKKKNNIKWSNFLHSYFLSEGFISPNRIERKEISIPNLPLRKYSF